MARHVRSLTLGLLAAATWCGAVACGNSGTATPSSTSSSGAGGSAGAPSGSGSGAAAASQAGSGVGAKAGQATAGQAGGGASGEGGASGGVGTTGGAGTGPVGSKPLVIYWIDVEGGAATLLIAPNGEVMVVDAGNPGQRDAQRVADVLAGELKLDHIDHMVVTHYHGDHVGGVPVLAGLLPISKFYDHGPTVQASSDFNDYVALAGAKRTVLEPGDVLELGDLVLTFVTAAGKVIEPPLGGGLANSTCPSNVTKDMDGGAENGQSLGFVAKLGSFDFLDLGDLTWDIEQALMCPTNRVGKVDLFQVNHHGQDFSNSPQLVHAVAPSVAVMNNGATKGGHVAVFETLQASPGLQDVWALHQATKNDAQHNAAPDLIANPSGTDAAHYIKAVVEPNGAFTITNGRNGTSRSYASH